MLLIYTPGGYLSREFCKKTACSRKGSRQETLVCSGGQRSSVTPVMMFSRLWMP